MFINYNSVSKRWSIDLQKCNDVLLCFMSFQQGLMCQSVHSVKVFGVLWKAPTECVDMQTHLFSLALYIIPGHYWELGSVISFCTFLITSWGEGRLRKYTVSELHPHLPGGFLPWEEEQSLTHWPGGTRPRVCCSLKSSFGWCLTSFKWLLLHFLLHYAWVCPLWKVCAPMVYTDLGFHKLYSSWRSIFVKGRSLLKR